MTTTTKKQTGSTTTGSSTMTSNLIPAAEAMIVWNDDGHGTHDVYVCSRQEWETELVGQFDRRGHRWAMTNGCCERDWLKRRELTPEFVFGLMLCNDGFLDLAASASAVFEFAKIDTCEWARRMLRPDDEERMERLIEQRKAGKATDPA